jgi:hypothetical protein
MITVIPLYPVFRALHPIHRGLRHIFAKMRPWQTAIIIVTALFAGLPLLGQAQAADFATVPDPTLTPGAVRTIDPVEICTHSTREFRHWSREADDRILIEYGLPPGPHPEVEIDHLIPLGPGEPTTAATCGLSHGVRSSRSGTQSERIDWSGNCAT